MVVWLPQGSSTSDCMSKTLDSASAHFAASAVVSAPAPSRTEVTKEQSTSHNINGVVQPSGIHLFTLTFYGEFVYNRRKADMVFWEKLYRRLAWGGGERSTGNERSQHELRSKLLEKRPLLPSSHSLFDQEARKLGGRFCTFTSFLLLAVTSSQSSTGYMQALIYTFWILPWILEKKTTLIFCSS